MGVFPAAPFVTAVACSVQVLSACYAIWLYVRITSGAVSPYLGVPSANSQLPVDVTRREYYCLLYLLVPALVFGVWTAPLTAMIAPSVALTMV